jgi:hypothetical protein
MWKVEIWSSFRLRRSKSDRFSYDLVLHYQLAALEMGAAIWYYIGVPSGYYRYVHA